MELILKTLKQNIMRKITIGASALFIALSMSTQAQTNVFDNIIARSPDHTYLQAALEQEGLDAVLQDAAASYTVFAPNNTAFDNLALALGTDITGLLALPDLTDILKYHVLGSVVPASAVTNGLIATPLSTTNTLKLTLKASGEVFVNQAQVIVPDLTADNGTVHVLDAILLPYETVVDVAIDNSFTSLTAAVVTAELLPALTDPLAKLTVFAPTDSAFLVLADALGTDLNGVLASPELTNILLYHVVSGVVLAGDLTNGDVPTLNGQDITVDLTSGVMINSSNVTLADLTVYNGVVHVIDAVLVPIFTSSLDEGNLNDFNVYPNPASDNITIDMMGNTFDEAMVYDLNGRIVLQTSLTNNNNLIQIDSIKTGTYILTLRSNDQISTQKLQIL